MKKFKSIGMTGTRDGISVKQAQWIVKFLEYNATNVLHHGDCIGADDQVATLFSSCGVYIIAHPGNTRKFKAHCEVNDLVMPWTENFVRNRNIVNRSELLLGFPLTERPVTGSGTWHTIEYAKKQEIPVTVVTPSGLVIQ